jgi:hypothetical protein
MKICKTCGREKHKGLCDMAELTNGRVVHVSRIEQNGDIHDQLGENLKVKNRWRKPLGGKKGERNEVDHQARTTRESS